jgi:hypothetical protein
MDGEISVEISRLYISFFNRAADPEGLQYWVKRYNEAVAEGRDGKDFLEDMADSFAQSPEAKAIYETTANPTDAQIEAYIAEAYQNMFGRVPDDEGLAYWAGRWKAEMAEGKPGVRVLFEIENAARGSSNADDVAALQNKAEVAAKFTSDFIASGAEWTDADFATAGSIVDGVDHTPESVQQANDQIAEFIEGKTDPDGGQEPEPVDPVDPSPPPLPEAVIAINASSEDDMLNILKAHASDVFTDITAAAFDILPDGKGREGAIANGVYEHIQLFGSFTSIGQIKSVVEFHAETELAKHEFIGAVRNAKTQEEMLAAMELGKGLSQDRQDLIDEWSAANAPQAAKDRAVELQSDPYTKQLQALVDASPAQLHVLAHAVLEVAGSVFGVDRIVETLADVKFNSVQHIQVDDVEFTDVAVGTTADDDEISFQLGDGNNGVVTLLSEGVEIINNANVGSTTDLGDASGVDEVWTDYSGATDVTVTRYNDASLTTTFGAKGNSISDSAIHITFADSVDSETTVKLAVDNKAGSFTQFEFDDGGIEKAIISLSDDNKGYYHVGSGVKNIEISGKGNFGYFTFNSESLEVFDASGVEGDVTIGWGGDGGGGKTADGAVITTGSGDDNITLSESTGKLTINAGAGNDTIYVGSGTNTFVLGVNFGNDTIHGFKAGRDKIDYSALLTDPVEYTQNGNDLVITYTDAGDTLTLVGVNIADFTGGGVDS